MIKPKSKSCFYRLAGFLVLFGALTSSTFSSGTAVNAAVITKVTWKVSSLQARVVLNLSTVVSTNSSGQKTWSKRGSCSLVPSVKPVKLKMGAKGSCELTLKIARSKNNSAATSQRTINLSASKSCLVSQSVRATCSIGDIGPGGGTVFYVASSVFTSAGSACGSECRYLEAAPDGWITASTPSGQINCFYPVNSSGDPGCVWSGNTESVIGSTRTGIGTGFANTSAMILQSDVAGKAATVARAFQGGGKTDWFLPSKDELYQFYFQRSILKLPTAPHNDYYWSSSECNYAIPTLTGYLPEVGGCSRIIGTGMAGFQAKRHGAFVRPVRAF